MKKFYYHWYFCNFWQCAIVEKTFFDREKCVDIYTCNISSVFPDNILIPDGESCFSLNPNSGLTIEKIKQMMGETPQFIQDDNFSNFVEECILEELTISEPHYW